MKKYLYALALPLALLPLTVNAERFPVDAETHYINVTTNVTNATLEATSTATILDISLAGDPARTTTLTLYCGGTPFYDNNGQQNAVSAVQILCINLPLRYTITGNGGKGLAFYVTDVHRNISLTDPKVYVTNVSTTTAATIVGAIDTPNFNEWLLGLCVMIFMLSLLVWRLVFSPITTAYGR